MASIGRIGEEKIMRKGRATPDARTAEAVNSLGDFEASYAERRSVRPVSFLSLFVLWRISTE